MQARRVRRRKTSRHGKDKQMQQSFRYIEAGNLQGEERIVVDVAMGKLELLCLSPSQ